MAARIVICLSGRPREDEVRSGSRRSRRVTIASGLRMRIWPAASSMASGRPSSRAMMSATAAACASVNSKAGRTDRARSTNRATAAELGSPLISKGWRSNSCSPYMPSGVRLVTSRLGPSSAASDATSEATAGNRCSALSSSRSVRLPSRRRRTVSARLGL